MSADRSRRAALSVWTFEPTYQALQDAERALAQAQEAVATARSAWARVVGSRPEMFPPEAHAASSGGQAADLQTMPGQADAHLRALLRYTEGFYLASLRAQAVPAHNFGKPLGWAVVADTPEHPKQHGMLCGGAHTFKWQAEQAASDPAHGKCVVIPLGPMSALEAAQALATTGAAD